jgi:hypothetical protein
MSRRARKQRRVTLKVALRLTDPQLAVRSSLRALDAAWLA